MNLIKFGLATSFVLMLSGCQTDSVKKWNSDIDSVPMVRVGKGTAEVIKISRDISELKSSGTKAEEVRLEEARNWLNEIRSQSVAIDQLTPINLRNIDTVNLNAYLYVDDYSIRLSKVRVGVGEYSALRLAALGQSDQNNIYSNLNVYNCQERTAVTAIVHTYTASTGETQSFAPEPNWLQPQRGSAQRWLMNAVCSATLVKDENNMLSVGYSVLLHQLD